MIRVGYTIKNLSLKASTNATTRGQYLNEREQWLAPCRRNVEALSEILEYNIEHGLDFRMSPNLVPHAAHPDNSHDWSKILSTDLKILGSAAQRCNVRFSMHLGNSCSLASNKADVLESSIEQLRYATTLFELLECEDGVLVVNLGGRVSDRERVIKEISGLVEPSLRTYLALEPDQKVWSQDQLMLVADQLNVPIVMNNLVHDLSPGEKSWDEYLTDALERWGDRRPMFHLSSQQEGKRLGLVADEVFDQDLRRFTDHLEKPEYDLIVSAKTKEDAAFQVQQALLAKGLPVRETCHEVNAISF